MRNTVPMSADTLNCAGYWNRHGWRFQCVHPRLIRIRQLIDTIELPPGTVLDVGCGPGAMKQLLPSEMEYFGIDIASDMVDGKNDVAHFEIVDLNNDPQCFHGRKFDLIICSGIFEYVQRPAAFIRFLQKHLCKEGHIILSYNNRQHYQTLLRSFLRRRLYTDPQFNFVSIPQTLRLLRNGGFRIVRRVTLTRAFTKPLVFATGIHFPFNIFNRQFIFLCRHR